MVTLSASKIKKLQFCSWSFACDYYIKLPRTSNDGARRGTTVHLVLECLLNPRHKKHYDRISKFSVSAGSSVDKLIRKSMKREGCDGEENYNMICEFLVVGLNADFFMEGFKVLPPEWGFNIKTDKYHIIGFIDKLGVKDGVVKVVDFKTSKQKFSGEDIKHNTQALMYQLAVLKTWPEIKRSFVNFLFLKFKRAPLQVSSVANETLKGFEEYLAYLTEFLEDFDWKKATGNFAKDDFLKKNLCGTREDRFKEDGSPKWVCPHQRPMDYFVLMENGKQIKSVMAKEELEPKDGQTVEKRWYGGCPKFFSENYKEEKSRTLVTKVVQ